MSQRANGAVPGPTHSAPKPESKDRTLPSASLIFSTRSNTAETNDGAKAVAARLLGALTTNVVAEVNCLWSKVLEFCNTDNVHGPIIKEFATGKGYYAIALIKETTLRVGLPNNLTAGDEKMTAVVAAYNIFAKCVTGGNYKSLLAYLKAQSTGSCRIHFYGDVIMTGMREHSDNSPGSLDEAKFKVSLAIPLQLIL